MAARRVFINSASGAAFWLTHVLTTFILTPVLVKALGDQGYGIWELTLSIVGYMGILDLGLTLAVTRFIAFAVGQEDQQRLRRVFGTSLVYLTATGLLAAVVVLLLSNWADELLNAPGQEAALAILFYLVAAVLGVRFGSYSLSACLLGLQRHFAVNGIRMLIMLFRASAVYVALVSGIDQPLIFLASAQLVSVIVESILLALALRGSGLGGLGTVSQASWETARELYRFGLKTTLGVGAGRLRQQGLLFVIAHVLGTSEVIYFAMPARLAQYAMSLVLVLGQPLAAYFSTSVGRAGVGAVAEQWRMSTRVLQGVAFGLCLGVAFLGVPFIARWVGEDYATEGKAVLYVLTGSFFVWTFAINTNRLLLSVNRHGSPAAFAAVVSLIAVVLAIPLAHGLGLAGAALTILATATAQGAFELRLVSQILGTSWIREVAQTAVRFAGPLTVGASVFGALAAFHPARSYPAIMVHGALGTLAYGIATWLFAFTRYEREAVRRVFRKQSERA